MGCDKLRWTCAILAVVLCVSLPLTATTTVDVAVEAMISSMSVDGMLGQMMQLDISTVMNSDMTLNREKARSHAKLKIGSYLNSPSATTISTASTKVRAFSATEWRNVISKIQEIFLDVQGGHPILYGIDSVHGAVHVEGNVRASDLDTAKTIAKGADFTIIAIGEGSYAEKPGDIEDLAFPPGQVEYVRQIAATGTKIILVLVQGRPRLLSGIADLAHAVVYAMLPGEIGGQPLAEIIYGGVNPSGRLPITYPKYPGSIAIPYNHRVTTICKDKPCEMEWGFGHGLSYTTFEYSNLTLSKTTLKNCGDEHLSVDITVANTGLREGKETVMLFLTQPYRTISVPEMKQLKKFNKISLKPGEGRVVSFELSREDWSVFDPQIGRGFNKIVENGDYVIAVKPETDCDVYNKDSSPPNPLCTTFSIVWNGFK